VFVALGTQHAMRMRRIVLPSVACLYVLHFTASTHNTTDSGGRAVNDGSLAEIAGANPAG